MCCRRVWRGRAGLGRPSTRHTGLPCVRLDPMSANLLPSENITFTTVRIECLLGDGDLSVGTAFFFKFPLPEGRIIPVLATNWHVVESSVRVSFRVRGRAGDSPNHVDQQNFEVLAGEHQWIKHPD